MTVASLYGAPDRTVEAGLVVVVGGNEPRRAANLKPRLLNVTIRLKIKITDDPERTLTSTGTATRLAWRS